MRDRFDVVIAGAGPAGGQCARDLAERNYDVLVLETEPEEQFPRQSNKSTAGTFPSAMTAFAIPDEVVMQYTDKVVLESPNDHYTRTQTGAVLERPAPPRRWRKNSTSVTWNGNTRLSVSSTSSRTLP